MPSNRMSAQDSEMVGAVDIATELDALTDATAASSLRAWLLVHAPAGSLVLELGDGCEVVIGRGQDLAISTNDPRASRRHARIWRQGPSLWVEDLGSRNGTRLNAAVLRREHKPLGAGDVVRIADREIVVALTSSSPQQVTASQQAEASEGEEPFVVADASMSRVFQVAARLAAVDTTALILGETGVGKEVLARHIHTRSARRAAPFLRLNCPALPETLLESELFGYERGAFTGASRSKQGLFEAARGGTLLLDEIGDLPLSMQTKLLSVLENRSVLRLGSTKETPVDVRVLCATHRDLRVEVEAKRFREDLYYRVSPFTLRIPPLRERTSEILLLASLFARRVAMRMKVREPVIAPETAAVLVHHSWPGNVRELRNAIEHAMILLDDGVIRPTHLPETFGVVAASPSTDAHGAMRDQVTLLEQQAIAAALAAEGGNQTRAAQRLGISRRALIYKMQKYAIQRPS